MAAAVEMAYRTIRDGIVSGVYRPGDHLTAQGLAAASGISRTPVREAMRRLHAEGLIRFIANRGAFVTNLDERDISKIYDLRVVLESYAAETAAQEATTAQIDGLDALALEMAAEVERSPGPDIDRVTQLNSEFHKLIVTAAANPRLETALASIVEMPLVLRTFLRYRQDELRRSMSQHVELVEALRARDGTWARSVMSSHILAGRNTLLRSLEPSGEG
ncbi:MAG TPA: GntR family transcriptional regulator [Caulobacteraceae bacterium]|jgi:DNA-binding GntR family transcriptional regulator|nr:GntR family transcriptional regulator [Caulobacteraceae bacterium]